MIEKSLQVPPPLAPHPQTLADPLMTIEAPDQRALLCYCPRHWCGAIFDIAGACWLIYTPLSFNQFCETLVDMEILPPAGQALDAWLTAIQAATLACAGESANDSPA
jgi:hypothetical protein